MNSKVAAAFESYTWAKEELAQHFENVVRTWDDGDLGFRVWNKRSSHGKIITFQTLHARRPNSDEGRRWLASQIAMAKSLV